MRISGLFVCEKKLFVSTTYLFRSVEGLEMKDPLMQEFIETQTGLDFAKWRHWATDHGHPHGSYSEFIGRLSRCQEALKRRGSLG